MSAERQELESIISYLASLSTKELKQKYLSYEVKWVYIAELKERKIISDKEMADIVGWWR